MLKINFYLNNDDYLLMKRKCIGNDKLNLNLTVEDFFIEKINNKNGKFTKKYHSYY